MQEIRGIKVARFGCKNEVLINWCYARESKRITSRLNRIRDWNDPPRESWNTVTWWNYLHEDCCFDVRDFPHHQIPTNTQVTVNRILPTVSFARTSPEAQIIAIIKAITAITKQYFGEYFNANIIKIPDWTIRLFIYTWERLARFPSESKYADLRSTSIPSTIPRVLLFRR